MEDTEKKIRKMYKDAVIEINQDYINKLKDYMTNQIEFPEKTMRREIIDYAGKLRWSGYRGKEIVDELFKIVRATQEEMGLRGELNE